MTLELFQGVESVLSETTTSERRNEDEKTYKNNVDPLYSSSADAWKFHDGFCSYRLDEMKKQLAASVTEKSEHGAEKRGEEPAAGV